MKIRPVPGVVVVAGFRVTWTLRARAFRRGASAPPERVFGTGRHSQGLIFWFSGFSVLSFSVFSFFGFCFFGFCFFGFRFSVFSVFSVFGFQFQSSVGQHFRKIALIFK